MEQQRLHTSFSKICEYAEQYALDRESENAHDMRSHYASADPHDLHASAAECSFIAQLAQTVDARTVIAIGSDNEMEVQYLTETLPSGSLITVVNAHSKTGPGMRNSYSPARSNTNNVKLRTVTADINEYLPRLNENDYDMVILGNGAGDPQQIAAAASRLLRPQGVLLITDVLPLRSRLSPAACRLRDTLLHKAIKCRVLRYKTVNTQQAGDLPGGSGRRAPAHAAF